MHYCTNNQSYKLKESDGENGHTLNQLVRNNKSNSLILCIQIYAQNHKVIIVEVVHYKAALESMFIKLDTVLHVMQWL